MGKLDKDSLADINVDVAHSTYGWLCTNVRNCGTPLLCNEDNGYNFTPVPFTKKNTKVYQTPVGNIYSFNSFFIFAY